MSNQGAKSSFAKLYKSMSEQELHELASDWHSLVDEARSALTAELANRNIIFEEPPQLKEEDKPEYRNLVTIRRYRDLSEAIVARSVVESAGIFCFLQDENFVRLRWPMSNLLGGIRLQVAAEDEGAAEAVLAQSIPDSIPLPDEPDFEQPHCPRCSSTNVSWQRRDRRAALLSVHLLSLPLPRGDESWQCSNCGLRWIDEDDDSKQPSSETDSIGRP